MIRLKPSFGLFLWSNQKQVARRPTSLFSFRYSQTNSYIIYILETAMSRLMAPSYRLVLLRMFFVWDPGKTSWSSGGSSFVNERPFNFCLLSCDGNKQKKSHSQHLRRRTRSAADVSQGSGGAADLWLPQLP